MLLPERKLEQVDYYEVYKDNTQYDSIGKPVSTDKIVVHWKDEVKERTLFGLTLWTKKVPGGRKEFVFKRRRNLEDSDKGIYSFGPPSDPFKKLWHQLEAYFGHEFYEVYTELLEHEIEYITS